MKYIKMFENLYYSIISEEDHNNVFPGKADSNRVYDFTDIEKQKVRNFLLSTGIKCVEGDSPLSNELSYEIKGIEFGFNRTEPEESLWITYYSKPNFVPDILKNVHTSPLPTVYPSVSPKNFLSISKMNDEWFIISHIFRGLGVRKIQYSKCDQIDGLIKYLEDAINKNI